MHDNRSYTNASFLDKKRLVDGADNLRKYYNELKENNPKKASELINDSNLSFSALFILHPELKSSTRSIDLNSRNKNALEITNNILEKKPENIQKMHSQNKQEVYSTLKWMFETGYSDDGMSNQYDKILETSAVLLLRQYGDKSFLHKTAELIFLRHRNELFIYDLVWALFECRDVSSLIFIAEFLRSPYIEDVKLARKLLSFVPYIRANYNANPQIQYSQCVRWIKENAPFLYYTGEGFQQTNKPIPYAISLEAKYLCKPLSAEDKRRLNPLTEYEKNLLERFSRLNSNAKLLLSNCSYILNRSNFQMWSMWIHYPISEQIKFAWNMSGGLL